MEEVHMSQLPQPPNCWVTPFVLSHLLPQPSREMQIALGVWLSNPHRLSGCLLCAPPIIQGMCYQGRKRKFRTQSHLKVCAPDLLLCHRLNLKNDKWKFLQIVFHWFSNYWIFNLNFLVLKYTWDWGYSSVAENLLNMCEALDLIPRTTKERKEKRREEGKKEDKKTKKCLKNMNLGSAFWHMLYLDDAIVEINL